MSETMALYFGCRGANEPGHYLQHGRKVIYDTDHADPTCPWCVKQIDGGLLRWARIRDRADGRVFWTHAVGTAWLAFFWWDNSGDGRGGSNSAFLVKGFSEDRRGEAFAFAADLYPWVIERQRHPLMLQYEHPGAAHAK